MTNKRIIRLSDLSGDQKKKVANLERRLLLKSGLSIGAMSLLSGCNLQDGDAVDEALWRMSRWNDKVQSWLFNGHRLAPTYSKSDITKPFPFNAFYPEYNIPEIDTDTYSLTVSGEVSAKTVWKLDDLIRFNQRSQITRLICIEGWSAVGEWAGIPLREFLVHAGADIKSKYVEFRCADNYYCSLDMASALHPQTVLATGFNGESLSPEYGAPLRLRVPTKLGFKNAKHITDIIVTNKNPGGYWEDQGYNWFSGI